MKNLLLVSITLFVVYTSGNGLCVIKTASAATPVPVTKQDILQSDDIIANAFANHARNLQTYGQGIVTALLPDDSTGSRHQRFIIMLASGQTLLIVHNIDIAPRIDSLQAGDTVAFYGEYEWNEKGGLIHWTHRDPGGSHVAGWIEYNGQMYQ